MPIDTAPRDIPQTASRIVYAPLVIALTISVVAIIHAYFAGGLQYALETEGVGVELASAVVLGIAVLTWTFGGSRDSAFGGWHVSVLLLALALRELDFDKSFLADGIFKLRFYSGDAPLWHKLIGAAVITLILWALARLLRRSLLPFLGHLRRGAWPAILTALAILSAAIAKSLDGIARKLGDVGITISERTILQAEIAEEALELLFAFLLVHAISLWKARERSGTASYAGARPG